MKNFILILGFAFCSSAFANQDIANIDHVIRAQWEAPNKPLNIDPVVIEGNYAIAGWAQGERGGRALLRRKDTTWEVFMCGGDGLTNPKVLEQSGLEKNEAAALARKLKEAEQGLSVSTRKQLSIFEGVVPVEANSHHQH